MLFATVLWDGGSAVDSNWTTGANWVGDVAPSPGDDLLFPGGAARLENRNTYTPGTLFRSITFSGSNYILRNAEPAGSLNTITITGGVRSTNVTGNNAIETPLVLAAPQTFMSTYPAAAIQVSGTINNSGFTITGDGSGSVTLGGVLSGTGGVVKNGPGTLTLAGNSNTYGGLTTVNAGILGITGFGAPLGSTASGTIVNAGATLLGTSIVRTAEPITLNGFGVGGDVPGNTLGALACQNAFLTCSGPITLASDASIAMTSGGGLTIETSPLSLNGHTLTANAEGPMAFNSPIVDGAGGPGNVIAHRTRTAGTVSLNAANTYTGTTTVQAGTLVIGDTQGPFPTTGSVASAQLIVGPTGTLKVDNNLNLNNVNRIPDTAAVQMAGGTFEYLGSTRSNSSETVGTITLARGHSTIRSNGGVGGAGTFEAHVTAAGLVRNPRATAEFNGTNLGTAANNVRFTASPATVGNAGGILPYATINLNDFATYNAALGVVPFTGYATLAAAGPGDTVRVSASETLAASKTVNALLVVTPSAPTPTSLTLSPGVTLGIAGGAVASVGPVASTIRPSASGVVATLAFGTEAIVLTNGRLNVTTEITGGSGLTLSGPSEVAIAPPAPLGNRYTGGTTINSGSVVIGANSNTTNVNPFGGAAGGTLDFYGGALGINSFVNDTTVPNPIAFDGATVTFTGLKTINFTGPVGLTGRSILAPPSSVAMNFTGQVSGPGGLTIRAGSPGGGTVTLSNNANDYAGGTLLVNNGIFTPTLALGGPTVLGTGPVNLYAGNVRAASGLLTLNYPIRFDGAGVVAFNGTHPITLAGPIALNGNNNIQVDVDTTFAGPISGPGAFTKSGSATLNLTGNNTFGGAAVVTQGALLINTPQPTIPLGINGGTLGGTGPFGPVASVTPVAGPAGSISPGNPPTAVGVLTASSADFSNGSGLTLQVAGYNTAGVDYDRLELGGGPLTLGGTSTLTVDLAGVTAPGTAAGVIRYGQRVGGAPFTTVNLVNNPNNFTVTPVYGATAISLVVGGTATTPITVQSIVVNDGATQRSKVTAVRVTFNQPVALDDGAITLAGRDGAGAGMGVGVSTSDNRTFLLIFTGAPVVGGSLEDGVYDVSVTGSKVHALGNAAVTMAGTAGMALHRLFSDADGDGDSDNADLFAFRAAYGAAGANPAYRSYFDYDADGDVDNADLLQVRSRRGKEFKGYQG